EHALQRRDIVQHPIRLPSATAVFLNQKRNDALRELAVRRALSRAVDRRALIANVLHGAGEAIGGPPIPGFASVADPPEPDALDLESAAALLDAAKWVRLDQQTLLATRTSAELRALEEEKKKAGKPAAQRTATDEERKVIEERVRTEVGQGCAGCAELPYHRMRGGVALTIAITTPDVPELVAMAEYIRDQWRAIGVRARVETVPLERVRGEIIPNRSYDTLLFSQILGPDPDPFPFWHSSQVRSPGLNLSYFSNRAIDKLLEDARTTLDREERGKKYAAFQKLLAEEHPAVFLTTPMLTYAITNAVRGVHFGQLTAPTDRLNTIADWYTETERVWRRE
ncbi:hypothetical protein HY634_00920, partial [Candidatus Uhrbacteria bacterium]|nr:hypothetical protein [Candidatus Uhrbacteria bacterium]